MDKTELKEELKNLKNKQKEEKIRYKLQRPPFKIRAKKITDKIEQSTIRTKKKIHNKIHAKKIAISDLKVKLDYIVDSLKATANTTDEIRKKTIEDIVENIADL